MKIIIEDLSEKLTELYTNGEIPKSLFYIHVKNFEVENYNAVAQFIYGKRHLAMNGKGMAYHLTKLMHDTGNHKLVQNFSTQSSKGNHYQITMYFINNNFIEYVRRR